MSLRLVKVVIQPILVWDDGDSLREVQAQPVEVAPAEWPDYPAALAEQVDAAPNPFAVEANGKPEPVAPAAALREK